MEITYTKKLTAKKHYDVIVCGGGLAGVAAAVSVANNGLSVLLLEKSNILGKSIAANINISVVPRLIMFIF